MASEVSNGLPHYAYRAQDKNGQWVACPVHVDKPEEALHYARDRGHHVVMLYKLVTDKELRFQPLLSGPNLPLPEELKCPHPRWYQWLPFLGSFYLKNQRIPRSLLRGMNLAF